MVVLWPSFVYTVSVHHKNLVSGAYLCSATVAHHNSCFHKHIHFCAEIIQASNCKGFESLISQCSHYLLWWFAIDRCKEKQRLVGRLGSCSGRGIQFFKLFCQSAQVLPHLKTFKLCWQAYLVEDVSSCAYAILAQHKAFTISICQLITIRFASLACKVLQYCTKIGWQTCPPMPLPVQMSIHETNISCSPSGMSVRSQRASHER